MEETTKRTFGTPCRRARRAPSTSLSVLASSAMASVFGSVRASSSAKRPSPAPTSTTARACARVSRRN